MPNKHFCQGPNCHTKTTQDRFLKSRGVIRGRYALNKIDSDNNWCKRAKYFCSTRCESEWLDENMLAIEMRIPVPFITHRRESGGYEKVVETSQYNPDYKWNTIKRVDRVGD
tara:strand:+ start:243 stop:578 length:336 start_codon:yes stop_codon:yes gene_type:complete